MRSSWSRGFLALPLNAFPDAQEAEAQGLWNAAVFSSGSPLLALYPWATGTPRECKLRWADASSVRLSADVLCWGNRLRLLPDAHRVPFVYPKTINKTGEGRSSSGFDHLACTTPWLLWAWGCTSVTKSLLKKKTKYRYLLII